MSSRGPLPFRPFDVTTATASITPTTTTANVALSLPSDTPALFQIRYVNNTGSIVFVKAGTSNAVTATTSNKPLLSGATEVFTVPNGTTYVAAILASGTATGALYITTGEGV